MLVLDELQKRWRESSSGDRLLGDKLAAMETKCDQLEEKLADARSVITNNTAIEIDAITGVGLTYKKVSLAMTTWRCD